MYMYIVAGYKRKIFIPLAGISMGITAVRDLNFRKFDNTIEYVEVLRGDERYVTNFFLNCSYSELSF